MLLLIYFRWELVASEAVTWTNVIHEKLYGWWIGLLRMLPNVMLALLFWLAFFVVARLFRRFGNPVTRRLSRSKAIAGLFFDLIYIAILIAGLYVGLNILKLDKIAVSLLAGAGIVGLTLAFAFQDLTSNFISGVYIDFNKPFDIGDIIETNGITGAVEDIGLRSTVLKTMEGTHLMMPNRTIFQNTLINHSRSVARQVKIDFEMTIQDSMDRVGQLIIAAIRQVAGVDPDRPPEFFFTDIDANNVKVSVLFWIASPHPAELMKIRHQAILAVIKAFADHGIKRLA